MRVLVATDFSPAAAEAMLVANAYPRSVGAALAISHVVTRLDRWRDGLPQGASQDPFSPLDVREKLAIGLREHLARTAGRPPDAVEIFVDEGKPYAEIVRRAETWRSDLVVIGACGSTGLARMLLGSVTEDVVRYAPCPVLVVRRGPPLGRVLVATDLSDPSLPAVEAGVREARRLGVALSVMYVVDSPDASAVLGLAMPVRRARPLGHEGEDLRRRLVEALDRFSATGDVMVVEGRPAVAIVRMSDLLAASLVVVGTRGRTGLSRIVLGSVATDVVRSAPCSVLAVRIGPTPPAR